MVELSIVVPCYNYGRYLKVSLHSILSQDYSDYEIVLVDDGSTDDTKQIGQAYADQYSPIRYLRLEQNRGIPAAVKIGVNSAHGKYLHLFSSDDKYLPGFLSKSMHIFHKNPDLNLVCSTVGYFQDGSDKIESTPPFSENKRFRPDQLVEVIKDTNFNIPGTTCVLKRHLFTQYGGFDHKLENISDWFLFHKIAFSEGVFFIPETLLAMRTHQQTYSSRVKRNTKRRRATFHHLLHKLINDKHLRQKFIQSGLLNFVFRDLKWKLYLNPQYKCYWISNSFFSK